MKPARVPPFSTARRSQPAWLRATNSVGRLFPKVAAPSASEWWEKAQSSESDPVDPTPEAREALDVLVDSICNDMKLSLVGRISARDDTIRMARTHLRIRRALRSHPEIEDLELPAPVFILGWPRTGTTALHQILARDPSSRTIPYWESFDPVPPRSGPDRRVERLDRMLRQLSWMAPSYDAIHPMTPEMPEECVALFMNELRTLQYDFQYRVPTYVDWLLRQDPAIAYRGYRNQLRLVHFHREKGERFVLKDPTHLVHLETILDLFPMAKFIFTHRDPASAISSLCSLHAYTRALFTDHVDPEQLGQEIMAGHWPRAQDHALSLRGRIRAGHSVEVRHPDLVRDPLGTIERVYDGLDLDLSSAARDAMRSYVEAQQQEPRTVHEHRPEGFGLTREIIRDRFREYCTRFDV